MTTRSLLLAGAGMLVGVALTSCGEDTKPIASTPPASAPVATTPPGAAPAPRPDGQPSPAPSPEQPTPTPGK